MPSHPTFPRDLSAIDIASAEFARRPTLSTLLGQPLPSWLDDDILWERVWMRVIGDVATQCWVWTAGHFRDGGGKIKFGGTNHSPYRIVYQWLVGPIPSNLVLDHLCRNRLCVNPSHLEAVSNEINVMRGQGAPARHARKTQCPQGHPYDEENTIILPGGKGRRCRICAQGYYAEHREQVRARQNAAYRARAEELGRTVLLPTGLRTHCKYGHEFTPENTRVTPQGVRQCRECGRRRDRERYPARAEDAKRRAAESRLRRKQLP